MNSLTNQDQNRISTYYPPPLPEQCDLFYSIIYSKQKKASFTEPSAKESAASRIQIREAALFI
jgi:hypothetical protein